jgi:hypothetical protein
LAAKLPFRGLTRATADDIFHSTERSSRYAEAFPRLPAGIGRARAQRVKDDGFLMCQFPIKVNVSIATNAQARTTERR